MPDTGGGVGWDKDVIVGEGEPKTGKLVSGMVPPFGGPGAAAAGGIGAMIGLLLLSTSAMWALYKFKPGLLPGWGKGGGVGGGAGAPLLAKTINATGAGAGAGAPTPNLQVFGSGCEWLGVFGSGCEWLQILNSKMIHHRN